MPFSFTFKLSVPGLSNPFSRTALPAQAAPTPDSFDRPGIQEVSHRRPSPVLTYPTVEPLSRKRAWEPAFAEPSRSRTTLASTKGYVNIPAKYSGMASKQRDESHEELNVSDPEMPPTKRRRGLAGSIVSTALSAALIGTAVGLTVYRLWRDRGKEPERLPPPPPYQEGEWTPEQAHSLQIASSAPIPSTPRSRKLRPASSTPKRPIISHRRTHTRTRIHVQPTHPHPAPPALFPPTQPAFDFGQEPMSEPAPVEDKMDWIGDKLSMLIEEGKKALNREVVVMSDSREDEVDDGSGAWVEEEQNPATSVSRSNSIKRTTKRPRSLAPSHQTYPHPYLHTPSPSPLTSTFDLPTFPQSQSSWSNTTSTPHRPGHSRGLSVESGLNLGMTPPSTSFREGEGAWESPELRESMGRARAKILASRGMT